MDSLTKFHYDKSPFGGDYEFQTKARLALEDYIVKKVRLESGLYVINGGKAVGKTFLLHKIGAKLGLNEEVILLEAGDSTNIIADIAEALHLPRRSYEEQVLAELAKIRKGGQNVVLMIDDACRLPKDQIASLAGVIAALPAIRVIATSAEILLKKRAPVEFAKALSGKFRLKHLSFIEGVRFVKTQSYSALALSQYDNPFTFWAAFWLSFVGNRNIENLNFLGRKSLEDAAALGQDKIRAKNVFHATKANFNRAKENLYHKFQKIFIGIMLVFSIYTIARIAHDRFAVISELSLRQSIEEQEKKLRSAQ